LGSNAKANGSTVTLTDGVDVVKSLTVPAGVTLDLTTLPDNRSLSLKNGAILTVNGTVNARGDSGHGGSLNIDSAKANPATINGSGTINLKSKGCLLGVWKDKKLTLDGVTLVGLADNNDSLVVVGDGGELVLKSGKITGNTRISTRISEEWAGGGGVHVWQAKFTMEGGEISGNATQGDKYAEGGGVIGDRGSVFTMTGGTISGNTAKGNPTGVTRVGGGGVSVKHGSTFTMTGGAITGNTATSVTNATGGGVLVNAGTFTMTGGTISGNTVTGAASENGGGGVDVNNDSTFTMQGGTIYGNVNSLPAGTDPSLANNAKIGSSMRVLYATAKWGTGGTYTKGGVSQTGGSNIVPLNADGHSGSTNDTLIAVPRR
jgi:hypothetical protein